MKRGRTVQIKIKELCKVYPHKSELAKKLEVTQCYVYQMLKGLIPGARLYRDILKLHEEKINKEKN